MQPLEAECKFIAPDPERTRSKILELGGVFAKTERHVDTYLRHPCRDFRATDEALRIRQIDDDAYVTYKGKRREGPIKIRPETELPLASNTVDGWLQIWESLGFERVQQVKKTRQVFQLNGTDAPITVTLDHVAGLGDFVEIERLLNDESQIESAQQEILGLAEKLHLGAMEKRSYLSMSLGQTET
ncbi:MAG: class IV adenylate cyclase [Pirellula sp.]|nr:class IV adenylate cyclase [Pirellula sp.]